MKIKHTQVLTDDLIDLVQECLFKLESTKSVLLFANQQGNLPSSWQKYLDEYLFCFTVTELVKREIKAMLNLPATEDFTLSFDYQSKEVIWETDE